jgi:WD40 repeat protein
MYFAAPDPFTFAINLYDPDNGFQIIGSLVGHTTSVGSLSVADRVPRLATADTGMIKIWDTGTMSEVTSLPMPNSSAQTTFMAFDETGQQLLITGTTDEAENIILKWDLVSQSKLFTIKKKGPTSTEAFFIASNTKITSAEGVFLGIWDATTAAELEMIGMGAKVNGVAKCPDDAQVAVAMMDGCVAIVDVVSGQKLRSFVEVFGQRAYCVCFSGDSARLAAGLEDGRITVWEVATGSTVAVLPRQLPVYDVSLNTDGTKLACFREDSSGDIYDVGTGENLLKLRGVSKGQFLRPGIMVLL